MTKNTWDLSPLFEGDDDPKILKEKNILREECEKFVKKWRENDDYLRDPKIMKEALDEYEIWSKKFGVSGKQGYYYSLRAAQDQSDPKIKAAVNKLHELSVELANKIEFFTLSISKIPEKDQSKFLKSPILKEYHYFLKRRFEVGKHLLSEPEEKIMNLKGKVAHSNWERMISEFFTKEESKVLDESGEKKTKTYEEMFSLLENQDKNIRKSAGEALEKIFSKHLDAAEHEINSILENHKVDDKLRGFERPDGDRHLGDDIDAKVVDVLREAVVSRYSLSKKYYKFKTELLGLPKLKYYERNVGYGQVKSRYPYEKAANLLDEVFSDLDEEFSQIFKMYRENGQFDVFPRKGKVGGAFCAHYKVDDPTYILLNHTKQLNRVLTMAHEVGHGVHNEFMKKNLRQLYFGAPVCLAEVASTFMEDFVLQRLMQEADEEEELALRIMGLEDDIASIFRQISFYEFEFELHNLFREKGYLTATEIGKLFKKHMKNYMGDVSEGSNNWWTYVPHFRSFFYVYSYASGLLASKYLQKKVKQNPDYINKVKEFLAAGSSDSPQNIFNNLGIDITDRQFWLDGLDEIDREYKETVKLAEKLGKI